MKGKPDRKFFGISLGMIFNIIIMGVTIFLVVYFVFSKDGLIDLIKSGLDNLTILTSISGKGIPIQPSRSSVGIVKQLAAVHSVKP